MKKIILTLIIAVLTVLNVEAQAEIGIKGGVSFASIMGDTPRGLRFRTAYNVGLVAEFETSASTSVQPEIMYSSQGFHYDGGRINGFDIAEDNYKLDYLNIPVVFKYYYREGAYFELGPQVGFLLSAKTADNTFNSGDLRDNLTNASFDFLVGLGYKFDNGFNVNARYVGGLTNIWKDYERLPPPGYWYYYYGKTNSVFQITVGYYFN
jgi:hypothetical protein